MSSTLVAGAATVDITPTNPQALFGFPHVERISTGVHDRLLSSALYLCYGQTALLLISNDVAEIDNQTIHRARQRIERETGVAAANIMITASHTHSGPVTLDLLCIESDAAVPKADPVYIRRMEEGIVEAAIRAYDSSCPAVIGLAIADGSCVGGNRHDPAGPSDPEVPVLVVRDRDRQAFLAAMIVCSMHPTVLHEDSTLISGDFPAMARQYLQEHVLGTDCPVLYHIGPAGNQSPRHVTRANTFDEATRLGHRLGCSIAKAVDSLAFTGEIRLGCSRRLVNLPAKTFPTVKQAQEQLDQATKWLESLRQSGADRRQVRTAECDWFGAEVGLTFPRAVESGRLHDTIASVMPAEITLMRIGPWAFVGWPGEAFVEFSLKVKSLCRNCYVISLANGNLQGYLVTEEAVQQRRYEAMNSVFSNPESGMAIVEKTLELLHENGTV